MIPKDLCDFLTEGSLSVTSLIPTDDDLTLQILVYSGREEPPQTWRICCEPIYPYRLLLDWPDKIELFDEHPILWQFTKPYASLYFSQAPTNLSGFYGDLNWAHDELCSHWLQLSDFLNNQCKTKELLSGSKGLFAQGPINVITSYCEVLQAHNMNPSIVDWKHIDDVIPVGSVQVLVLEKSYFIGEEISFQRLK